VADPALDLLGRLSFVDDAGLPIVLHLDREPHAATRRLMDSLGVEVVVTATCEETLCNKVPRPGARFCRAHSPIEELREQPATAAKRRRWTRETAVAAVQAFAREHGRVPSANDMSPRNGLPALPLRTDIAGGLGELVELAGFPRPLAGGVRQRSVLAEREPTAGETALIRAASRGDSEPSGAPAAVSDPVAPPVGGDRPEAASRSANTEPTRKILDPFRNDPEPSDEGEKEEVPLEELLTAFGRALAIHRTALAELAEVSRMVKAHPDYQAAKDSEWL
jgi:hypothetical protein